MELLNHLWIGLESAVSLTNLLYCFVGVSLGTLVGVLPGMGPVATVAMLLPITYALDPSTALIMLSTSRAKRPRSSPASTVTSSPRRDVRAPRWASPRSAASSRGASRRC